MSEAITPSSPLSSAPSSHPPLSTALSQSRNQWRAARKLPFELHQYVRIYFEESLFTRALDLLLSVVTADASSQRREVTIPHPDHIALTATLVVHPLTTTRTTLEEKQAESNAALRLLRLLLNTVGPVNAQFEDAFKFRKLYDVGKDEEADPGINHPFANEHSIWQRADSFWAVVGWAFNCSCLTDMYTARWENWQVWLEFMVDALEADWQGRLSEETVHESMIWRYISHSPGNNAHFRRVIRAIFADGTKNSLNEFHEIFKRELKEPKTESDKIKQREAVDIDNEVFGDYLVHDDSSDESCEDEQRAPPPPPQQQRTSTRALSARRVMVRTSRQTLQSDFEDDSTSTSTSKSKFKSKSTVGLGPPESIELRLRLMQLLAHVSSQPALIRSRTTNCPDLTDLFTFFVEFIKPLPLSAFQQMTSPSVTSPSSTTTTTTAALSTDAHTTLLEFLLQRLLETPSSSVAADAEPLTQSRLETEYLPYAASKTAIDANARVSLCVEGLLRNLANARLLRKSSSLQEATESGIDRRMAKIRDKRDKVKQGSEDEEALAWLMESSARMRAVLRRLRD